MIPILPLLLQLAIAADLAAAPAAGQETQPQQEPPERSIGLVPSADAAITASLAAGARAALAQTAAAGGPTLQLVIGETPGAWSTAAGSAVELLGRPGMAALISPPERMAAHAVAQVATRAQIWNISTCAAASLSTTGSTWVRTASAPGSPALEPFAAGYRAARAAVARLQDCPPLAVKAALHGLDLGHGPVREFDPASAARWAALGRGLRPLP